MDEKLFFFKVLLKEKNFQVELMGNIQMVAECSVNVKTVSIPVFLSYRINSETDTATKHKPNPHFRRGHLYKRDKQVGLLIHICSFKESI